MAICFVCQAETMEIRGKRVCRGCGAILETCCEGGPCSYNLVTLKESTMSWEELVTAVEIWAHERQIIPNSTPTAQLMKTMSELGELADATIKHDALGVADGLGDVLVTLIIYAKLSGMNLRGCLETAYDTIKDRKGTLMSNGVFVKEESK